jgi:hypothetical protein
MSRQLPWTVTGGRGRERGASEEQSAFSRARGRGPPPEFNRANTLVVGPFILHACKRLQGGEGERGGGRRRRRF